MFLLCVLSCLHAPYGSHEGLIGQPPVTNSVNSVMQMERVTEDLVKCLQGAVDLYHPHFIQEIKQQLNSYAWMVTVQIERQEGMVPISKKFPKLFKMLYQFKDVSLFRDVKSHYQILSDYQILSNVIEEFECSMHTTRSPLPQYILESLTTIIHAFHNSIHDSIRRQQSIQLQAASSSTHRARNQVYMPNSQEIFGRDESRQSIYEILRLFIREQTSYIQVALKELSEDARSVRSDEESLAFKAKYQKFKNHVWSQLKRRFADRDSITFQSRGQIIHIDLTKDLESVLYHVYQATVQRGEHSDLQDAWTQIIGSLNCVTSK